MLMMTSESVIFATCLRSLSMSAPFLPMTTPGRAEWMVTRHFLCGRSITILDTAACLSCFISQPRILMSSCSSRPYCPLAANQRESQVRLMPSRKPDRIYLLTHQAFSAFCSTSRTTIVRLANGLVMLPTRPRARGVKRLMTMALPTCASATTRSSTSRS